MKIKKILILIMILISSIQAAFSFKIYIADLNVYREGVDVTLSEREENAAELIYKEILKADLDRELNIHRIPDSFAFKDRVIKSKMDAAEACRLLNIDYLLYGFIEKTNQYYNAEIKLFDYAHKDDIQIFYVKSGIINLDTSDNEKIGKSRFDQVIEEIAYKFTKYMYRKHGLSIEQTELKKTFGGIGIYTGTGYWFPLLDWWDIMTGLVCFEHGVYVIPLNHLAKTRNFAFNLQFGFFTEYSLAMNKPGYLTSYFNSLHFRIPVEICFEVYKNHTFKILLSPQLQFDILYQEMLYEDPNISSTAAFSLYWGYSYEYWFGEKKLAGLGIKNSFNYALYETDFITINLQIYNVARIPININKLKKEK